MKRTGLLTASLAFGLTASVGAEPSQRALSPVVVISEFEPEALPTILAAEAAHAAFGKVPVYIGQYGISKEHDRAIHRLPTGRYAPIFTPRREDYPERRLSAAEEKKLPAGHKGPIPGNLTSRAADERLRWGLELGRRIRDRIRAAKREGVRIDAWQFDEIWPSATKQEPQSAAARMYLAGIVHGIAYGRPQLGDKRLRGMIFISNPARFAKVPATPDMERLLWELEHAALRVMGEEYPVFRGDPVEAARAWAAGQAALAARSGLGPTLAARYAPAFNPGYNVYNNQGKWSYLNGNADDHPDAWVDQWRQAFITERMRLGAAGIGEYCFTRNNSRAAVIRATLAAVARGVAELLDAPKSKTGK